MGSVLSRFSRVQTLRPMDCSPPVSSVHGNSPGKNPGVVYHALLQSIFLTQGSNPHLLCLLHWQSGSLPLVLPGKHHFNIKWQWRMETVKKKKKKWGMKKCCYLVAMFCNYNYKSCVDRVLRRQVQGIHKVQGVLSKQLISWTFPGVVIEKEFITG